MDAPTSDSRTSVVVATRNRSGSLGHALAMLQALPERPRVVVADNGSGDDTAAVVRNRGGAELVELGRNLGSAARNVGVRRVQTPYVAFSDDDSWWAPGALRRAADLLDAHPDVALLTCRILVGPDERIDPNCPAMRDSPLGTPPGAPGPLVLGFIACGTIVRRDAFLGAGGFDDRLGIGGEERLVSIELARRGWQCCYIDDLVAYHHPSPDRDRALRSRVVTRNDLWSAWLRRRPRAAVRITLDVLRDAARDPHALSGVAEALAGAVWVLAQRDPVPPELDDALSLV